LVPGGKRLGGTSFFRCGGENQWERESKKARGLFGEKNRLGTRFQNAKNQDKNKGNRTGVEKIYLGKNEKTSELENALIKRKVNAGEATKQQLRTEKKRGGGESKKILSRGKCKKRGYLKKKEGRELLKNDTRGDRTSINKKGDQSPRGFYCRRGAK